MENINVTFIPFVVSKYQTQIFFSIGAACYMASMLSLAGAVSTMPTVLTSCAEGRHNMPRPPAN